MVVAWIVWVNHYETDSEHLRSDGGSTSGTVTELSADTRYSSGSAKVAYTANGRNFVRSVDLGSFVDNYSKGQSVKVYYDRQHPEHMTINDETNQPGGFVFPMIVLGLGGLAALGSGIVATWRYWTGR